MGDITTSIIYYSSNQEDPKFEDRIVATLSANCNNLPIISVSHKPMSLGTNICIGEQPVCYSNLWKQLLLGLKTAKTKFCVAAESDCLYPPDYFQYTPPKDNLVYRYNNVWAYWNRKNKFWKKPRCEGAQICGREYWIERLEYMLDGHTGWEPMENPSLLVGKIFPFEDRLTWGGNPVITFITGRGISTKTSLVKSEPQTTLPYWGTSGQIREKYLCT